MNWKDNFENGKEIILATASKKGIPNANVVIALGFVDGKLLVADCQMDQTIRNLKENNNICVVGGYYRIKGTVEIFASGKYFDLCVEEDDGYEVQNAILITVDSVFDLSQVAFVE